jgi:hypothetical protein
MFSRDHRAAFDPAPCGCISRQDAFYGVLPSNVRLPDQNALRVKHGANPLPQKEDRTPSFSDVLDGSQRGLCATSCATFAFAIPRLLNSGL